MNREEIEQRAKELIQCCGIWDMTVGDVRDVAKEILLQLSRRKNDDPVPNILEGTGLTGQFSLPGLPGGDDYGVN